MLCSVQVAVELRYVSELSVAEVAECTQYVIRSRNSSVVDDSALYVQLRLSIIFEILSLVESCAHQHSRVLRELIRPTQHSPNTERRSFNSICAFVFTPSSFW